MIMCVLFLLVYEREVLARGLRLSFLRETKLSGDFVVGLISARAGSMLGVEEGL